MKPRLLIIGATGVLGRAATLYFLQNNFPVRALVRNKEKAADLEKAGAEMVVGDLTSPDTIEGICNDVDVILTAAHGMLGKGKNRSGNIDDTGHKHLIDAAKVAGVSHFIYTSTTDASKNHPIDFFRTKYAVEQYLISSGLNYTILRMAAFMEWHVHNLLGKSIREKGKTVILGPGNNPTNFVAVQDIVRVLEIIAGNKTYYNKILKIAGPENMSRNDVAKLYGKLMNTTPRITHVPVGILKFLTVLINPFHPGIGRIMKLSAYYERVNATMNAEDSVRQFGLEPTTIESFIKKQLITSR